MILTPFYARSETKPQPKQIQTHEYENTNHHRRYNVHFCTNSGTVHWKHRECLITDQNTWPYLIRIFIRDVRGKKMNRL